MSGQNGEAGGGGLFPTPRFIHEGSCGHGGGWVGVPGSKQEHSSGSHGKDFLLKVFVCDFSIQANADPPWSKMKIHVHF